MNVKENKSRIKPNIKSLKVIHKPSEYGRERGSQKSSLLESTQRTEGGLNLNFQAFLDP